MYIEIQKYNIYIFIESEMEQQTITDEIERVAFNEDNKIVAAIHYKNQNKKKIYYDDVLIKTQKCWKSQKMHLKLGIVFAITSAEDERIIKNIKKENINYL